MMFFKVVYKNGGISYSMAENISRKYKSYNDYLKENFNGSFKK